MRACMRACMSACARVRACVPACLHVHMCVIARDGGFNQRNRRAPPKLCFSDSSQSTEREMEEVRCLGKANTTHWPVER